MLDKFKRIFEGQNRAHGIFISSGEVSDKNKEAINFYEKNNFVFLNFRHNYYNYNNETFNARCYQKIYK